MHGVDQQHNVAQQQQHRLQQQPQPQFYPQEPIYQNQLPIYENGQHQFPQGAVEQRRYQPRQPTLGDYIPQQNKLPQNTADRRPYRSRQAISGSFAQDQRPIIQENRNFQKRPILVDYWPKREYNPWQNGQRPFVPGWSNQGYARDFNGWQGQRQQQSFIGYNGPHFNGPMNQESGAVYAPQQRQQRARLNRKRHERRARMPDRLNNQTDALPVNNRFAHFETIDQDEVKPDETTSAVPSAISKNEKAPTKKPKKSKKTRKAEAQIIKPVSLDLDGDANGHISEQNPNEYKSRPYLRADHIRRYLYSLSKPSDIGPTARHINRFVTVSAPIYDAWIRDNYEYQVVEKLLEIGTKDKHWAHEIVKKSKSRDDNVNRQYCIDRISELQRAISNHGNAVTKLQSELIAFAPYYNDVPGNINNNGTTVTHEEVAAQNARKPRMHIRLADNTIQEYLKIHTKKCAEICANRVHTAYAELKEFENLKTFEEKATPLQRAHVKILKGKLDIQYGKQKNVNFLKNQIQMGIIPKTIPKIQFSPHLDDRVLKQDKLKELKRIIDTVIDKFQVTTAETLVLIAEVELASIDQEIQELDNSLPPNFEPGDNEEPKASDLYKLYFEARQVRMKNLIDRSVLFLEEQREAESMRASVHATTELQREARPLASLLQPAFTLQL
ncbi:unnamed protein product [Didymodactylos carnosus]|uniref:Uncharacterized protein n=1 Tax=Didymodactylos carnosus TaxID=1234261 RepID=A0A8S2DLD8_9BILA|nr:unnamed protein product [Didymodactylos carnosus]CAF3743365.1 unnamed protein product [Didymodactylos carnosus]